MTPRHTCAFVSFAFFVTFPVCFSASGQSRLLAVNQKDHTLSVFDPASEKQVAVVTEDGYTGHEIAVSPDGRTAYVPIYGSSGVGKPGTDGDHIDIIDLPSAKLTGTIAFPHGVRPHCALFDDRTGLLLVSSELDRSVTVIDPKTRAITGSIPTGQAESHMIVESPDGSKLYSANVGPGTVSVMDVKARKLLKVIPISGNTQRISMTRDGSTVFTADQTKPELVAIDTATAAVKQRIALPGMGYGTAATLDGKYLLVAMDFLPLIAVVDLKTMKVMEKIAVPKNPSEIIVSPDGKTAYASLPTGNEIAVIDLKTFKSDRVIAAGGYTDGLAWAAASR